MAINEAHFRSLAVKELKKVFAIPVENGDTHPGTPDIAYLGGWIEMKYVKAQPKRKTTILRLDHFTPQQRVFLKKTCMMGGVADLIVVVKRDWLLLDGQIAASIAGRVPYEELKENCINVWPNGYRKGELLCAIQKRRTANSHFQWESTAFSNGSEAAEP